MTEQMRFILDQNTITPDEGLFLLGELASDIALLNTDNVQTSLHIKEIEKNILSHLKQKLTLALDLIRVNKGFVRKH